MPRTKILACAALSLALAPSAHALIGGVIDANSTASPWAGVVSITPTNGGVYSGALISPGYVLTAAHVAAGYQNNPSALKINVNYGGNLTQQITASEVFVHPDFTKGNLINDSNPLWNDDVAVIRLSQPVAAGVPTYTLFNGLPGSNGTSSVVTLVAYGGIGDGVSASVTSGANAAVKSTGANRIEFFYAADNDGGGAPPGVSEGFLFTLDGATAANHVAGEAGYAGGDSGSPVFINDHGTWRIVGVGAFNGTSSTSPGNSIQFGAIGGGMLIAPYAGWIQQQMAAPVPEPRSYALMLSGLALLGAVACRRGGTFARAIR